MRYFVKYFFFKLSFLDSIIAPCFWIMGNFLLLRVFLYYEKCKRSNFARNQTKYIAKYRYQRTNRRNNNNTVLSTTWPPTKIWNKTWTASQVIWWRCFSNTVINCDAHVFGKTCLQQPLISKCNVTIKKNLV